MYDNLENFKRLLKLTLLLRRFGLKADTDLSTPLAVLINSRLHLEYQREMLNEGIKRSKELRDYLDKKV